MDPIVVTILLAGGVVVVLAAALVGARRRRERSIEPVRLGPAWSPRDDGSDDDPTDGAAALQADARVTHLAASTDVDPSTVAVVLRAWDEYLAVIGIVTLPAGHRYEVYDPYDPPVAERRDGRPVPDATRVARDIGARTVVSEADARLVLGALVAGDDGDGEPAVDDQRTNRDGGDGRRAAG